MVVVTRVASTGPAASTTLQEVLRLLGEGVTAAGAAARLGVPAELVAAMVDELERLGLLSTSRTGLPAARCTSCAPRPTCRGCPLGPAE